jgi:hypothetical protein
LETCKPLAALNLGVEVVGKSPQKDKISHETKCLALYRLSRVLLQLSVSLVLQKGRDLPITVNCTKYHGCIALVGRKDGKLLMGLQDPKRPPIRGVFKKYRTFGWQKYIY